MSLDNLSLDPDTREEGIESRKLGRQKKDVKPTKQRMRRRANSLGERSHSLVFLIGCTAKIFKNKEACGQIDKEIPLILLTGRWPADSL